MRKQIGTIDEKVISILNLSIEPNTPIFLGETNIKHMKQEHPEDFKKYGDKIEEILNDPDYIAKHPRNDSIQYIKVYYDEEKQDYVMVAVRTSKSNRYYARTLFVMNDVKVKKYKEKDAMKKYPKEN